MVECEFSLSEPVLVLVLRFNRYMVECESRKHCFALCDECTVLIDTWWNVNLQLVRHLRPLQHVLIDTWWNVNTINLQATGLRI